MPNPISVKAVGKPSMIATTISPSISSPIWPFVIWSVERKMPTMQTITTPSETRPTVIGLFIDLLRVGLAAATDRRDSAAHPR